MSIYLKTEINGAADLVDRLKRTRAATSDVIEKNLRSLGKVVSAKERQVLQVVKYKGTLERSVSFEYSATPPYYDVRIGPTAAHRFIVRTGTKPHWAPIAPLKEWAKWKLGDEGAAYAIQRKIAYHGTSRYLAQRGVPFTEQTEFGIGLDYPSATLARGDVKQGIARTAQRIGLDICAAIDPGAPTP